jgi:hypothetical protein
MHFSCELLVEKDKFIKATDTNRRHMKEIKDGLKAEVLPFLGLCHHPRAPGAG